MSRGIVSVFLACHLAAVAVNAIPSPDEMRAAAGMRESLDAPVLSDDALSFRIRPVLDAAAWLLEGFANGAWQVTVFVRTPAKSYVESLGLEQVWKMFANPPRGAEYLRVRYYSARIDAPKGAPLTMATELVFPVAPDTEHHMIRAYWEAHRDKAISNAFGAYFVARTARMEAGLPPPVTHDPPLDQTMARSIVPVGHFFADRYARTHLGPGDRLVRTEAWYGSAPSRIRGELRGSPLSRAAAIARYYRGLKTEAVLEPVFQSIDTVEREADILWLLIYIQT